MEAGDLNNPNMKAVHEAQERRKRNKDKKIRQSGLRTKKPYISSSIGTMIRHMLRMCLQEQTVGMTLPPAVEFYDFWRKFSISHTNLPADFVDERKISVAKLKLNTSSFDFLGEAITTDLNSFSSGDSDEKKKQATAGGTHKESDDWDDLRESFSSESFISRSTQPSVEEKLKFGAGWGDGFDDDYRDSDEVLREERIQILDNINDEEPEDDYEEMQEALMKETDTGKNQLKARNRIAIAAAAKVKQEQDRLAKKEAVIKAEKEIEIQNLLKSGSRESSLDDAISYGMLSDDAFTSDFDFFNEHRFVKRRRSGLKSKDDSSSLEEDPDAKLVKHKAALKPRRIPSAEVIASAEKCRSTLTSSIPKKGQSPLTRKYETIGPGPAAYFPKSSSTPVIKDIQDESKRFTEPYTVGPGPAAVNLSKPAGTGQPHAIIFSKRGERRTGRGRRGPAFTNCANITRHGRPAKLNALIIGRYPSKIALLPDPGMYDAAKQPSRKIGIILKSRIPQLKSDSENGFLALPPLSKGPAFSMGSRKFPVDKADSPGPIYNIPPSKRKPISMTFKPFPMRGRESDPSPLEYGNGPAEAKLKILPRAPTVKIAGRKFPEYGNDWQPAPNMYHIPDYPLKNSAIMFGRYKTKLETTPGPAAYLLNNSIFKQFPRAVFQHKGKVIREKESSPGFIYTPKFNNKIIGGLMSGWCHKI